MKRNIILILSALGMIFLSLVAVFWMDKTSYQESPMSKIDPAAVGASMIPAEIPKGEGPVIIGEIQTETHAAERVPNPFFWMAVGAGCAGLGVFVAARDWGVRRKFPRAMKFR